MDRSHQIWYEKLMDQKCVLYPVCLWHEQESEMNWEAEYAEMLRLNRKGESDRIKYVQCSENRLK